MPRPAIGLLRPIMSSLKSRGASGMTGLLGFCSNDEGAKRERCPCAHEQRQGVAKILRRARGFFCIEICRAANRTQGAGVSDRLDQGRNTGGVDTGSDRRLGVSPTMSTFSRSMRDDI